MIKFCDKKLIFAISAMIFLLTAAFSGTTLSRETQAEKQNVLRQASLQWMQVGIKQYESNQFEEAEKSFRRALIFRKYLTDAEQLKINRFLTKARPDLSEETRTVENIQPAKEEEKLKKSEPLIVKEQQQAVKEPKIINSRIEQKDRSVKTPEPAVPEIQLASTASTDVIVVKDKSFKSEFMRLSDWLSENRRNILMIGLPFLGVLVLIMKLQGLKRRPGRRIYAYHVPASSSFIGARLSGDDVNSRHPKGSKKRLSGFAAPAVNPKQKSFEQSTDHWKEKHFGHAVETAQKPAAKEKWPQQKDKSAVCDAAVVKTGQKQCGKCKQFKPHSDFYKNKSTKDGLARWCKQCKKEYRQKRAAGKK